jgi:hypothetical protein
MALNFVWYDNVFRISRPYHDLLFRIPCSVLPDSEERATSRIDGRQCMGLSLNRLRGLVRPCTPRLATMAPGQWLRTLNFSIEAKKASIAVHPAAHGPRGLVSGWKERASQRLEWLRVFTPLGVVVEFHAQMRSIVCQYQSLGPCNFYGHEIT